MEDLEKAEPNDEEHVVVERPERTFGETGDDVIERALPPQRSGDDLQRQRAVADVVKVFAAPGQGRRQIRPAGVNGAQRVESCRARWGDHRLWKRAPGVIGCPAR